MASSRSAAGPSSVGKKNLIGDALYNWARENQEAGYVFQQQELLDSGLIPGNDLKILVEGLSYLIQRRLFKPHDIKGSQAAGYELVEEAAAANYDKLSSDEQMVYSSIESAGAQGIWTKTIKAKSGVHAKVLDRVYKSLENRGLIKPMKSVKHPQRKMYIRAGLTPSEEATGGTWFNDGRLDIGMIEAVSSAIEAYCSLQSWRIVEDDPEEEQFSNGTKRKQPDDGFDETGKGKGKKTENGRIETTNKQKHPQYESHAPGYQEYPTLNALSKELMDKKITQLAIPNNAIQQVLDIMVYDAKICRLSRNARADETPDDPDQNLIHMYRCFSTPVDLGSRRSRQLKIQNQTYSAVRSQEIEEIGRGGFSEVPCLDCPVFEICGDGGPVSVKTCEYMKPWREKLERADLEAGDPWPQIQTNRKFQPTT